MQEQVRFVDIHTHILPGVDDGAKDMDDALALIGQARDSGTEAIVLTPHYRGRYRKNGPEQLRAAFATLQRKAPGGVELFLGNEIGYERELADKLSEGRVLTINGGRYVLLEFSSDSPKSQVTGGVLEVLNCGFVPIIAHAERYDILRHNRNLVEELLDLGALIQVNADSILGGCGLEIKRYCHRLLKKRMVHFVASDGHDAQVRRPVLEDCYRRVCRKYGEGYAAELFWKNARIILTDER